MLKCGENMGNTRQNGRAYNCGAWYGKLQGITRYNTWWKICVIAEWEDGLVGCVGGLLSLPREGRTPPAPPRRPAPTPRRLPRRWRAPVCGATLGGWVKRADHLTSDSVK